MGTLSEKQAAAFGKTLRTYHKSYFAPHDMTWRRAFKGSGGIQSWRGTFVVILPPDRLQPGCTSFGSAALAYSLLLSFCFWIQWLTKRTPCPGFKMASAARLIVLDNTFTTDCKPVAARQPSLAFQLSMHHPTANICSRIIRQPFKTVAESFNGYSALFGHCRICVAKCDVRGMAVFTELRSLCYRLVQHSIPQRARQDAQPRGRSCQGRYARPALCLLVLQSDACLAAFWPVSAARVGRQHQRRRHGRWCCAFGGGYGC